MGQIFRKAYTMPIPPGAEIEDRGGARIARWRLRNGQWRSGEVVDCKDGKARVRGQSRFYLARYRAGGGEIVEIATGCKDEVAARAFLSKLERQAELVRAGVLSPAENDSSGHADQPMGKHIDSYERHLKAKGGNPRRIAMVRKRLERLLRECRFSKLNIMSCGPVERWLVEQAEGGLSAATRNCYRESLVCFGNWCRRTRRLTQNPFVDLPRADQNVDRRHHRRALTEDDLIRLLDVARLRPLAERGRTVTMKGPDPKRNPKSRATWKRDALTYDNLHEAVARAEEALAGNTNLFDRLERTGRERALIYRTLVHTGLRKGELASLKVGQLELDGPVAYAVLDAADEKNRRGSNIPLREDLVGELSAWLAERLDALQAEARRARSPIPARLPASTPLFNVPSGLTRILDRDLTVAGIPKRDERGRVVDVHALRVTFGTHLCAAGVALRTAQAAMRHSKPELTANVYTDPKLLDIAGAVNALPRLIATPEVAPNIGTG